MRRSICFSEPSTCRAGEVATWRFIYTPAVNLPKGTKLKFDLGSQGRAIDWELPSSQVKKGENIIYIALENGKTIQGKEVETAAALVPAFEFVLPAQVQAGSAVTFVVGAPQGKEQNKKNLGTRAQTNGQRRRPFYLFIDPAGKGHYGEPEVFLMDIRGNELKIVKIITPSFVIKNRRFDVIVRFEDEFGNLTNETKEETDTLIELSHEHLRESLNWKLFIPETGFITLPNLYFNEAGVYTIQLKNLNTGELFRSSPIKCFNEQVDHLFWGLLHGESERVDSTENIESCLRHFRDEKALNFYACSPFENQEETPNEVWKLVTQNLVEFNEEDRFSTLFGFQWVGEPKTEGIRDIVLAKELKQIPRKKDAKYSSLKKVYKAFNPKEIISIPTFTMAKGFEYNFQDFNPDFERVVEIYNSWGSSERTAKEGNPSPIKGSGKGSVQESAEGSIQKALQNNCRFGFVAGGLDDRGIYSAFYHIDQVQYPPGLTAIISKSHTRDALLDALYQRSCYATTGEKIILGFSIAGATMGKELSTADKPGLLVNRHISGYAAGTRKLAKVEIIRNGTVIHTIKPNNYFIEFEYDDLVPLDKNALKCKDKRPPFVYYYIRVTQEDEHMAWSSPIWIDILPPKNEGRRAPLKLSPSAKKPLFIESLPEVAVVEEEEEDTTEFDDYEE